MSWVIRYGFAPMRGVGATKCQKTTETGTETVDTETASGIMALSQTTGHGIYFPSLSINNLKPMEEKQK